MPEKDLKKKLIAKRKSSCFCSDLSIYMFNAFDEYLEFCKSLLHNKENSTYGFLKNSALYLYKSKYYLCVYENDINSFKSFHYSIIEFATCITNSDLFERKLKEYGKEIFKTDAINSCVKHFE